MTCIDGGPWDLWIYAAERAREVLLASPLGGIADDEVVVDLFCGAGGWDEGAMELGIRVDYAVNHSAVAIETSRANHPWCTFHQGDAWKARPHDVVPPGVKVAHLIASAACTTVSQARGGAAQISKRVHMLGWCIARWMEQMRPRAVDIENVVEWQKWGPLVAVKDEKGRLVRDEKGRIVRRADPARFGQHFRRWWRYCERLGYRMEMRVFDAVDFGNPSRRKRLFIKGRCDGMPITWPERTHGDREQVGALRGGGEVRAGSSADGRGLPLAHARYPDHEAVGSSGGGTDRRRGGGGNDSQTRVVAQARGPCGPTEAREGSDQATGMGAGGAGDHATGLKPHRTAAECIDFTDLGRSIFGRKTPLKPNTLTRTCEGIRRFVLEDPSPFTVPVVLRTTQNGMGQAHVWSGAEPLPTQCTYQDVGVATPVVTHVAGPQRDQTPADRPVHTLLVREDRGVASAVLVGAGGSVYAGKPRPVDEPGNTVKCESRQGVGAPVMVSSNYGERPGQAPRCGSVMAPHGAVTAQGISNGIGTPVLLKHFQDVVGTRVDQPAGTLTTLGNGHHSVGTPILMVNTTHSVGGRPDDPAATVTTAGNNGVGCPVLVYANHGGVQSSRADVPGRTVQAQGNHAWIAVPMLSEYYGNGRPASPSSPLGCATTKDRYAVVSPVLAPGVDLLAGAKRVGRLMMRHCPEVDLLAVAPKTKAELRAKMRGLARRRTLAAKGEPHAKHFRASWVVVDIGGERRAYAVAAKVIHGAAHLVVDILFRMLRALELAKAMSFRDDFIWPTTRKGTIDQRAAVQLIGNAVAPCMAKALIACTFPRGRRGREAVMA
jgi:DNA (cytosine-5)-methyltransferase 1